MAYTNGAPNPAHQYEAKKQNLRQLDDETRKGVAELQAQIQAMRDEREAAMKTAATHAGNLGFVYNADTNEYIKVVSGIKEPEMPEAPPALLLDQSQFEAASAKIEQAERDAADEMEKRIQPDPTLPSENEKWYRTIPAWTIAVLVG